MYKDVSKKNLRVLKGKGLLSLLEEKDLKLDAELKSTKMRLEERVKERYVRLVFFDFGCDNSWLGF